MNDIITAYTEQINSETSDRLLFRYYPNLPAGSVVQVGTDQGDLEKYFNGECYEFLVDFFGEKKKLFLKDKRAVQGDPDYEGNLFEFDLNTIEDEEATEKPA